MSRCQHADSGCNYPESECAGLCVAMAPAMYVDFPEPPPKPSHTLRRVATVLGFMAVGICLAVLHHDYTLTLQRENDALRSLNMQLLRDQITGLECQPRSEDSKVIMQRIKGRLSCETHTIRKGI